MYCHTRHPPKEHEQRRLKELKQYENKDTGETLYIDARWVVLYANDEQKIPVERIRNCHRMINLIYKASNSEELAKVPDEHPYPFKSLIGNMNIQFLPLDESKVTVEYMRINDASLDSSNPVDDAAERAGIKNGVMNFYVGNCSKGILGQAALESNICFGLYSATGGYEINGNFAPYHLGKTWPHELGHAFSLYHTFTDDACDGVPTFSDIPETTRPGFEGEFYQKSDGKWSIRGDNRYLDRMNGTHLSCLHAEANPETAPNDMACNIMDYGDDDISVMFTHSQVAQARAYLLSPQNTSLELKTASSLSYSESHGTAELVSTGVTNVTSSDTPLTTTGQATPVPDSTGAIELGSNPGSTLKVGKNEIGDTWLAIMIVLAVLLVFFMGTTAWYYQKYSQTHKRTMQKYGSLG